MVGHPVIYLTGASNDGVRPLGQAGRLGLMLQPGNGYAAELHLWRAWAADNGCFAQGDRFDTGAFLAWLDGLPRRGSLFAVAPDVYGDAEATWRRAAPVLARIRELGFPAAYVAQDGIEGQGLDWDAFDCLFVGGTTAFKLAEPTWRLAEEARRRGKWLHMGRVNSWPRLRAAAAGGYHSADGTYLKHGPDVLLPKLMGWLGRLEREPFLWSA